VSEDFAPGLRIQVQRKHSSPDQSKRIAEETLFADKSQLMAIETTISAQTALL
jgi:hypothetical protein